MTPTSDPERTRRVALLGLGTVGSEVARALVDEERLPPLGPLELTAVGVRDPGRSRPVAIPSGVEVTADLEALVARPDIDIVVELIGGVDRPLSLVKAALERGSAVVTANKALLSRHGAALEACARSSGSTLRFEAAVGGGIPLLGPLTRDLAANRWSAVRGIVNGTTNYILSEMRAHRRGYGEVLAEAQARGFAEADPTADVEGMDAADKLAILLRLSFGSWPSVVAIRRSLPAVHGDARPGITGIRPEEIEAAEGLGLELRLVARARREGSSVTASAALCALEKGSALAGTEGVRNAVELVGEPVGRVLLSGPGAGGPATSSSVLGDLIAIVRGEGSTWTDAAGAPGLALEDGLEAGQRWFFVSGRFGQAASAAGAAVVERRHDGGNAFLTRPARLAELRTILRAAGEREATLYPILEAD